MAQKVAACTDIILYIISYKVAIKLAKFQIQCSAMAFRTAK